MGKPRPFVDVPGSEPASGRAGGAEPSGRERRHRRRHDGPDDHDLPCRGQPRDQADPELPRGLQDRGRRHRQGGDRGGRAAGDRAPARRGRRARRARAAASSCSAATGADGGAGQAPPPPVRHPRAAADRARMLRASRRARRPSAAGGRRAHRRRPAPGRRPGVCARRPRGRRSLFGHIEDAGARRRRADFRGRRLRHPGRRGQARCRVGAASCARCSTMLGEAIWALDCDVLLLAGRPSRLPRDRRPAARADRRSRRTASSRWTATGSAPGTRSGRATTCASATPRPRRRSAACCARSPIPSAPRRRLENFSAVTNRLRMRSTARYIGEMERTGQITDDKLMFADVDLDAEERPGAGGAHPHVRAAAHRLSPAAATSAGPRPRSTGLDFAASGGRRSKPFTVTIERADVEEVEDEGGVADPRRQARLEARRRQAEAMREAFAVIRGVGQRRRRVQTERRAAAPADPGLRRRLLARYGHPRRALTLTDDVAMVELRRGETDRPCAGDRGAAQRAMHGSTTPPTPARSARSSRVAQSRVPPLRDRRAQARAGGRAADVRRRVRPEPGRQVLPGLGARARPATSP